jgi:hypothetical protein
MCLHYPTKDQSEICKGWTVWLSVLHQICAPKLPLGSWHWDPKAETEVLENEQEISPVHVTQQAQDDPVKLNQ